MPRFFLYIEYAGNGFCGWQKQKQQITAQGVLEHALARLDPALPIVYGAGRTDSGVHAIGQVAHCDLSKLWCPRTLMNAVNNHVRPHPISVVHAAHVADGLHARFSAIKRHYLYRIITYPAPLIIDQNRAWSIKHALDQHAMQNAARVLQGKHDFTTFRSVMCQASSPVKTLDAITIEQTPYRVGHTTHNLKRYGFEYKMYFTARSFLHHQVRSMVGCLERVGSGRWTVDDLQTALIAKNRTACAPVSPPHGLYLTHVEYPENSFIGFT